MADFNTHIFVAAGAASFAATICTKLFGLPISSALLLTAGGTIGGILPDIDLKYSVPSKVLFSILGTIAAIAWLFARLADFTVLELWVVSLAVFLGVRFPLWALFHQFTVHRGTLHSLAAALMFAFLTAALGDAVLNIDSAVSWLLAMFVAGGYVIHLLLDEIYSVDFMGARIKRSFGSALKPIDTQRLIPAIAVLMACFVLWFATPETGTLGNMWKETSVSWQELLLPDYIVSGSKAVFKIEP